MEWVHPDDGLALAETFVPLDDMPDGFEYQPGQVTPLHGALWRVERVRPPTSAEWRTGGHVVVWIRKTYPRDRLREFVVPPSRHVAGRTGER